MKEYQPTGKSLSFNDLYNSKHNITPSDVQIYSLMNWMRKNERESRDFNLFDHPNFLEYALNCDECFERYLLRHRYIQLAKTDKWNPKTGDWVKVGWENIQEFQPGVMLNRVFKGNDRVMELKSRAEWRTTIIGDNLMMDIRTKNEYRDSGYYEQSYYLKDLFNGTVYMKVPHEQN